MPRPLNLQNRQAVPHLMLGSHPRTRAQALTADEVGHRLKAPRSGRYMEQLAKLDAGALHRATGQEEILQAIRDEFGGLQPGDFPSGILERCHLGPEFVLHVLDLREAVVVAHDGSPLRSVDGGGSIVAEVGAPVLTNLMITHYKHGERMPAEYERARALALHPAYRHIEVYHSTLICVRQDGTVTQV